MSLSVRSLAFRAFRCGSLHSVQFRQSSRSFTGQVFVAVFRSAGCAGAFAQSCAVSLGVSVFVVRVSAVRWSVSVPVAPAHSRLPVGWGRVWLVAGGLRGFVATLSRAGFVGSC